MTEFEWTAIYRGSLAEDGHFSSVAVAMLGAGLLVKIIEGEMMDVIFMPSAKLVDGKVVAQAPSFLAAKDRGLEWSDPVAKVVPIREKDERDDAVKAALEADIGFTAEVMQESMNEVIEEMKQKFKAEKE